MTLSHANSPRPMSLKRKRSNSYSWVEVKETENSLQCKKNKFKISIPCLPHGKKMFGQPHLVSPTKIKKKKRCKQKVSSMTLGVLMTDVWDEGHSAQNPLAKTESLEGEHKGRTDTETVLHLYLKSKCFSEHGKQAAISPTLGMISVRFLTGVSACVCCLRQRVGLSSRAVPRLPGTNRQTEGRTGGKPAPQGGAQKGEETRS